MSTQSRALITPYIDFWLVGGFSLVFLAIAMFTTHVAKVNMMTFIPIWAFWAAFAVNYPHFAHSYQLFYEDFINRMKDPETPLKVKMRPFIAGVIVPVLIIGYFAWCYYSKDPAFLGYSIRAMYFFVGWHYVKQGYGILITLSVYKGIFYSDRSKKILTLNAYAAWMFAWLRSNQYVGTNFYYDVKHQSLGFPEWVITASLIILIITSLLTISAILKTWLAEKKGISINGLVGYFCGVYMWVVLPYINPAFFVFVAFFHSLQYLPFVYKFKGSEIKKKLKEELHEDHPKYFSYWPLAVFAIIGITLGASFMHIVPKQIDAVNAIPNFSRHFYIIAFLVFINVHHYFIDSSFWRRDNKRVQEYLFRS
ncbi:MAG TPA: hypothetical protein PKW15_03150 [Alphaproteobacteria bacterium]|nr:hypothetical protein [Rhodospirillaceae bacterium]HRJ12222.1 hypothetical protein [Alphaproteobacteria bacterium]